MSEKELYLRFSLSRRIEHWVNVSSFSLLALTGMAQKFSTFPLSIWFIKLLGGIETARIIHRISAVVLALIVIFHIGAAIYHLYVKRGKPTMLPDLKDAANAWQSLKFNLGLEKKRPRQGFYTFEEKVEYWALVWGMFVMGITGFFLWNPITAAQILPGQYIPAAKAAHGGEALLAVLAIILWHLYQVFIKHFNTSMYTGYMTMEEMKKEHPLALEEAWNPPTPTDESYQQRQKRFWVGYSILAAVGIVGVWWFVSSENTALPLVEPRQEDQGLVAFNPLLPTAYPTQLPTPETSRIIGSSWTDGMGVFITNRCGDCHFPDSGKGNLDLTSYATAVQGGKSGPAIVPFGPGVSPILIWPEFDWHEVYFSPVEKAAVSDWIQNGAIE